jgi:hypothetical protein
MLETGQSYNKTEDIVGILHANKEKPLQTYSSHFTFLMTFEYVLSETCEYAVYV